MPRQTLPDLSLSLHFVGVSDVARHRAALPRHAVARCLRRALERDAHIAVRVVAADEGRLLNAQYRRQDHATNVLTFAYASEPQVQADLVLCADVVAREAREQRISLAQHYAHLLVHGALHAQGWDHETGLADARRMEARESAILLGLGWPDPYRAAPRAGATSFKRRRS